MTTASNKLWATAGAFALAATAVLVPVAAQAEPDGDSDSSATSDSSAASSDVGSAAGRTPARANRGAAKRGAAANGAAGAGPSTPPQSIISGVSPSDAPVTGGAGTGTPPQSIISGVSPTDASTTDAPAANNFGPNPLFQNPLWWFGTPNPTPPPPAFTNTFEPLASLPGWAQGYYGWYRDLNFEACVLGLSNSITPSVGPYGTSTSSISTGGC